jgi:hypothetical protein
VPFSPKVAGFQLRWNDEQAFPTIEKLRFGALPEDLPNRTGARPREFFVMMDDFVLAAKPQAPTRLDPLFIFQ